MKGDWGLEHQFIVKQMQRVLVEDSLESTLSLRYDVEFDLISNDIPQFIYDKGSAVIRMIQHILGDDKFINGIRKYLRVK